MEYAEILRRYRRFNPDTGDFDVERTLREYARVLSVDPGQLSRILNGTAYPGRSVLERLVRAFPAAADEIAAIFRQPAEQVPA